MKFVYSTGGREKYFHAQNVGDCVCRSICNATGMDYLEVYNGLKEIAKSEHTGKRKRGTSSVRNGVYKYTYKKYIEEVLGWKWHPCMQIGSGCQVHLCSEELPSGTLIVSVSGHNTCVKDGVLYDTYDCSRDGSRCVYGYWTAPTEEEVEENNKRKAEAKAIADKKQQAMEEAKRKIESIKKSHEKTIKKYELKLREINRLLNLETRRMRREIDKVKDSLKNSI